MCITGKILDELIVHHGYTFRTIAASITDNCLSNDVFHLVANVDDIKTIMDDAYRNRLSGGDMMRSLLMEAVIESKDETIRSIAKSVRDGTFSIMHMAKNMCVIL